MIRFLSATIVAALAPAFVSAQENPAAKAPAQDIGALFQQLDANNDGQLAESEVGDEHRRLFRRLLRKADKDGDGKLSRAEFALGLQEERPRPPADEPQQPAANGGSGEAVLFKSLDSNGDGTLSADELDSATASLKKLDKNGDGRITHRELGPGEPQAVAPQPAGNGRPGVEQLLARWKRMDKNGDGKLAEDELPPALKGRFDRVDANGDGFADQDELRRAAEFLVRQFRKQQDAKPNGQLRKRPAKSVEGKV